LPIIPPPAVHRQDRGIALVVFALTFAALVSGCSFRKFAANSVGNSLASGPDVFSSDNDPELVRDAVPFGLKTMESLLAVVPKNRNLLLAACRGFTQYAYAFVQGDADDIEATDYARATELRVRARNLFLRARDFGLRDLECGYKGVTTGLRTNPEAAVKRFQKKDVPSLFWTAAAWGSAISLGKDQADLLADLPAVRALIDRSAQLDEGFEGGSIHEALILLDALPPALGGSPEQARMHFNRAVELSKGMRASPYLTMAQSVSVMTQNRKEFHELLEQALTVDPGRDSTQRLPNIIAQRRAKKLLERENEFFLDDETPADSTAPSESH